MVTAVEEVKVFGLFVNLCWIAGALLALGTFLVVHDARAAVAVWAALVAGGPVCYLLALWVVVRRR